MHSNDPARLASRRARLPPETGRIGHELSRKIGNAQDLLAMKICELDFRSRRKEKLVLLQAIHVGFELRELRCADHAIAPDQKRRTNLDVTVLARVQIDHKIDQGA